MHLVGLVGFARSSKDTFAGELIGAARPHHWRRFAFADALKRYVANFLRVSLTVLEERKEEFRPVMQIFGKRMREIDPDCWLRPLKQALADENPFTSDPDIPRLRCEGVVVADVRYQNEADAIRKAGGVLVRIVRQDQPVEPPAGAHESEKNAPLITCDMTFAHSSVEEIGGQARQLLMTLR